MTTRDPYDIDSAGEPAPVVDYTRSQPIRPAAAFTLFMVTFTIATVALWELTGWLADMIWGAM